MIMFIVPVISAVAIYYLFKWMIKGTYCFVKYISSIGEGRNAKPQKVYMTKVDLMDGIEFENFVATLLKRNGYADVEVTKASGDYGVDILAKKDGKKIAFQCKCYSSNLGVKPVQEVYSGGKMYNAHKFVVVTNAYFTKNAVALANQLGVELWSRDYLMRLMGKQ